MLDEHRVVNRRGAECARRHRSAVAAVRSHGAGRRRHRPRSRRAALTALPQQQPAPQPQQPPELPRFEQSDRRQHRLGRRRRARLAGQRRPRPHRQGLLDHRGRQAAEDVERSRSRTSTTMHRRAPTEVQLLDGLEDKLRAEVQRARQRHDAAAAAGRRPIRCRPTRSPTGGCWCCCSTSARCSRTTSSARSKIGHRVGGQEHDERRPGGASSRSAHVSTC